MSINREFFVGFVQEHLDTPLEGAYGYDKSYHVVFIAEPTKHDWELDFIDEFIDIEEPVIGAVQVYGRLDDPDDLNDLEEWLERFEVSIGPSTRAIIDSAKALLQRPEKEQLSVTEEMLSSILDGSAATEDLAAFEGPIKDLFEDAKQGLSTGAKKIASGLGSSAAKISLAEGAGVSENIFALSKQKIQAALGGATPQNIGTPLAEIVVYLAKQLLQGNKKLVCSALLQNPAEVRESVDLVALIPSSVIASFGNIATAIKKAHRDNKNYELKEEVQKLFAKQKKLLLQTMEKEINKKLKDLGSGSVIVGYSNDKTLLSEWGGASKKGKKGFSLSNINWKSTKDRETLNHAWKALSTNSAKRSKLLDDLLPPVISQARNIIKTYLESLDKPFTDWIWDLLLSQAARKKDPSESSFAYVTLQDKLNMFETLFSKLGYRGLDLSKGEFSAPLKKSVLISQLKLIYTTAAKDPDLLFDLFDSKGWKSIKDMNALFDDSTKEGQKFIAKLKHARTSVTKDALRRKYKEYSDLPKGNATDETWDTFEDALAAASDVVDIENPDRSKITKAYNDLEKAKRALSDEGTATMSAETPSAPAAQKPTSVAQKPAFVTLDYGQALNVWELIDKEASNAAASAASSEKEFLSLFKKAMKEL